MIKINENTSRYLSRDSIKKLLDIPIKFYGNRQIQIIFDTNIPMTSENQKVIEKKFGLLFGLYFGVFFKIELLQNLNANDAQNLKINNITEIMDLKDINYFKEPLDDCQKYLLEGITNIQEDNIIDGFPKLVIWTDKYIEKNASGFCKVRDGIIHPDEKHDTRKKLEEQFPGELEFAADNGLLRDSEKNLEFLKRKMPLLLDEIKPEFEKKYLLDRSFFLKKPLLPQDEIRKS